MSIIERELGRMYTDAEIAQQQKLDNVTVEEHWCTVDKKLGTIVDDALRGEILAELKSLYSIYKKELIDWYANLYDPNIGGYYYSNSARDNETVEYEGETYELLPDLESTCQAIGVIRNSGMADKFDKDIARALPEWMKDQIVPFVRNMQDEKSGYFYHPQWGKELTDKWPNRRGRDLTWALRTLERYSEKPYFKSPLENRSEDKKTQKAETAPHLRDKESFIEYLDTRGFDSDKPFTAYYIGSLFESQVMEIVARDRELESEGANYRLLQVMKEWFDSRFNKQNGSWTNAPLCYDTCNGILKISSTYARANLPLPDPIKSLETVIKCVALDEKPLHICCILNPWYALNTIIGSVRDFAVQNGDEESLATLKTMRQNVLKDFPLMVRKTAEKLKLFVKADGSFSYFADRSADRSQNLPVAIPYTNEGDMNATMICSVAIPNHIFSYLGLETFPLFTESDRMRYVNILERNRMKSK